MTKRQGLRAAAFLVLLAVVIFFLNLAVTMPKDDNVVLMTRRFREMYSDPKDTWDGVVIGPSTADRSWAAPLAWEDYGMAIYPMSTDGQPFVLSTNLLEEVRKNQDIKFAVVELHGLREVPLKTNGGRIRWVANHMKPSLNQMKTVKKAFDYMDTYYPGTLSSSAVSRLSYYFPLVKFHDRLTSDRFYQWDINPGETKMKGAYEAERHVAARSVKLPSYKEADELSEQQITLLEELLTYAEETDLQLIFYMAPSEFSDKYLPQLNGIVQYLRGRGIEVLDFHEPEALAESGIDGETDFIDKKHLNTRGAYKLTRYLSSYIRERVDTPDHRGDARYQSWDDAAEVYHEFYEESQIRIDQWIANRERKKREKQKQ